jgi:hypothetical protein
MWLHKRWLTTKRGLWMFYVGLLGNVNDFVFWKSSNCINVQYIRVFWHGIGSQDGIPPYLFTDKGYPLLLWLVTSHKEDGEVHSILELLYNRKHKRGRWIVENAFNILKQKFRGLLKKTKLHIIIVLKMFSACCLFHNLLSRRKEVDVEEFMWVIQIERI